MTGGAGSDTINGVKNSSGTVTYSSSDKIDGGAGTDTLYIESGTATTLSTTNVSNVENIWVSAGADITSVTLSTTSAATTYGVNSSAEDTKFSSILSATTKGAAENMTAGTVNYGFSNSALSGTADTFNFAITSSALTGLTVSGGSTNAMETVALTASGADSTISTLLLTDQGTTKVTIAGAGDLTITAITDGTSTGATVKTIDGSASTGDLLFTGIVAKSTLSGGSGADTIYGSTGNDTISGGAGNDVIVGDSSGTAGVNSIAGGDGNDSITTTLSTTEVVDGGAGTDTLVLAATISYLSTDTTHSGSGVTNIEAISLTGNTSVDARALLNTSSTITSLTLAGTAGASGMTYAPAALTTTTVTGTAPTTVTVDRSSDTTADALTVVLNNATNGTGVSVTTLVVADEETLTIQSSDTANTVSSITGTDLTTLNITGTVGLTITAITGATALKTVDASASTAGTITVDASITNVAVTATAGAGILNITTGPGADSITGSTLADTITSGSGADYITTGAGADSIMSGTGADTVLGGAGNDVIVAGSGNNVVDAGEGDNTVSSTTGDDSITAGTGADSIDVGAGDDTISAGSGNDTLVASDLDDGDSFAGGDGTDTLAAATISTTLAVGMYVDASGDTAPTMSSIETAYVQWTASTANDAASETEVLDMTDVSGTTTLYLDVVDASYDAYLEVSNFGGTTVNLTELSASTADAKSLTVDGAGQASLTVNARNYAVNTASATAGLLSITDATAAVITATSFLSTTNYTNAFGAVDADDSTTVTLSTGGNTAANTGALTVYSLSASEAATVNLTAGAYDTLTVSNNVSATGSNVQTLNVTLGTASAVSIGDIDLTGSDVDTVTITVAEDGSLNMDDLIADTIASLSATFNYDSGGSDLDVVATIASGTFTVNAGATLTLTALGVDGGGDSVVTLTGRGAVTGPIALEGDDFSLTASGLSADSNGIVVTSAGLSGALTITSTGFADSIVGGAGNDSISTGAGADIIDAGTGANTITGGTGADSITGGALVDRYSGMGTSGNSIVASSETLATTIAAGNTITFYTGSAVSVDYISNFGATDLLDVSVAAVAPTNLVGLSQDLDLTSTTTYVMYGTFDASTGAFTAAAAWVATNSEDALIVVGDSGTLTPITTTGYVVLNGLTAALVAANFV